MIIKTLKVIFSDVGVLEFGISIKNSTFCWKTNEIPIKIFQVLEQWNLKYGYIKYHLQLLALIISEIHYVVEINLKFCSPKAPVTQVIVLLGHYTLQHSHKHRVKRNKFRTAQWPSHTNTFVTRALVILYCRLL